MPVSRALQRLLLVLDLEEEQKRAALESARSELARMERSREAAAEREGRGRKLITTGLQKGDLPDVLAGLAESQAGSRHRTALEPGIAAQKIEVSARREVFLNKRVERQQAETLIREERSEEIRTAERREQQALDEAYLSRIRGEVC